MYAQLCTDMSRKDNLPSIDGVQEDAGRLFRQMLLSKCQRKFEEEPNRDGFDQLEEDELAEKELLLKRGTLGHIRFVGELYKLHMLSAKVMYYCIDKLFGDVEKPDEENLECLCKLLTTIGIKLDSNYR